MTIFFATTHYDPHRQPLQWATALGEEVGLHLKAGQQAEISFFGMKGVSSSYFNALLLKLVELAGQDQVRRLAVFTTDSAAQRQILDRSIQAVLPAQKTPSTGAQDAA